MDNKMQKQPKNKVGRPRKTPINPQIIEKRCVGRPRKHPIESTITQKRCVGRPRKHPVKPQIVEKRCVGRPRKNVNSIIFNNPSTIRENKSCCGSIEGKIKVVINSKTTLYVDQCNKHKIPKLIEMYNQKRDLSDDKEFTNDVY